MFRCLSSGPLEVADVSREMRIMWLHNRLLKNDFAAMKDYTQKFGISVRQAHRDFKYLRANLGAPMKYSRKRGEYFYSEPYHLPSLFEDSMKFQLRTEYRISSVFLNAIASKKAVKIFQRGGKEFIFYPACFDERRELFCGLQEDGNVRFVRSDEIDKVIFSNKRYLEEPMLWNRIFPREAEFHEVDLDFGGDRHKYHFFEIGDLVMFLASENSFKVIGPQEIIDELRKVAENLLKTIAD